MDDMMAAVAVAANFASPLQELDNRTNGSLIKSLIRRELGLHDHSIDRIYNLVHRQIIKARVPHDNQKPVGARKVKVKDEVTSKSRRATRQAAIKNAQKSSHDASNQLTVPIFKFPNSDRPTNPAVPIFETSVDNDTSEHAVALCTDSYCSTAFILDDKLFVRKHMKEEPYFCFPLITLKTSNPQLQHKYSIPSKDRWLSWELFSPTMGNPGEIIYKKKFGRTLFILQKESPFLSLYDFDNGKLIQQLFLDPVVKFITICNCWHDLSGFCLQSSRASIPQQFLTDFITVEYPELRVSSRCRISKTAFPCCTGLEISVQFILINYSSSIEIYDLKEIYSGNEYRVEASTLSTETEDNSIQITHVVKTKLPTLIKFSKCFGSYFDISLWGSPPYFITKSYEKEFKVFNAPGDYGNEVENSHLLSFENFDQDNDQSLSFHPDESDRLILCSRGELRILKLWKELKGDQGKWKLSLEFYKRVDLEPTETEHNQANSSRATRRSLRTTPRINYSLLDMDRNDVGIKWEYHNNLDIFAMLEIIENTSMNLRLYDNQTWTVLATITSRESHYEYRPSRIHLICKFDLHNIPGITLDFTDTHITVSLMEMGSKNIEKVYLVNLLHERCEE